ncbi:MAG: 4Fe-4S dicluster domain-containing protein [Candidatus Lokiarchaeota archaeon]|nr:4Fe-4S dicluster domain-containing protein [Candidatus Lokiarchaeota archaeon]
MLETLMENGVISGSTSRSTGIKVYTLMPPFPGMIEFSLMKGEMGEKERKLAKMFDELFKELGEGTQKNYDSIMPQFKNFPPPARVIPVEEEVKVGQDIVLLSEEASNLIDLNDTIALAHCYCRIQKDLVDDPCKATDEREICLIFGKAAQYAIKYGFARKIDKQKAKEVIKKAEDIGLVHQVFHSKLDFGKDIDGICNCCKCCCGIFRLYYEGIVPFHARTTHQAKLAYPDECIACGTCVEKCPMEVITLNEHAVFNVEKCIGCGVCAYHCPQEAIEIIGTEPREVFVLPPRK